MCILCNFIKSRSEENKNNEVKTDEKIYQKKQYNFTNFTTGNFNACRLWQSKF